MMMSDPIFDFACRFGRALSEKALALVTPFSPGGEIQARRPRKMTSRPAVLPMPLPLWPGLLARKSGQGCSPSRERDQAASSRIPWSARILALAVLGGGVT